MVTLHVEFYTADGKLMSTWENQQQNGESVTIDLTKALATYTVNGEAKGYATKNGGAEVAVVGVDGVCTVKDTYVDEVKVTITGTEGLNWSASSDGKINPDNPSLEVTMTQKSGSGLSKTGTLVLTYTVGGVEKTVEASGTSGATTAIFTLTDFGDIKGDIEITITKNLDWKS